MFLCFNGKLPNFLANCFRLNMDIHDYNTRNALDYQYPRIRTTSMRNSVFFKGPEVWNSLPTEIKSSQSLDCISTIFFYYTCTKSHRQIQVVYDIVLFWCVLFCNLMYFMFYCFMYLLSLLFYCYMHACRSKLSYNKESLSFPSMLTPNTFISIIYTDNCLFIFVFYLFLMKSVE